MRHDDPFEDQSCLEIAKFLKQGLNDAYPQQVVVNGIRCYDAFNVPYSEFPLLKVYRLVDAWEGNTTYRTSQGVISYSLVLPDQETLAPIMSWVSRHTNQLLIGHRLTCFGGSPDVIPSQGYRAEYRMMMNEITQKVHSFLRFTFNFKDD
jgi:hypothetical protein